MPLSEKRARDVCAPWLNQSIRDLMRKRDIKRAAVKFPAKWSVYKQLRNAITKKINLLSNHITKD